MTTATQTEDTTITRIAALLNMAETTKNEHEAQAFMAKAQEIATRSAIDLDRARFLVSSNLRKPVLIQKRITIGERGTHGLFTYVELFLAIARANNVTCNISQKSTWVNAFGYDSDIEIVELLFASLLHQMVAASNAYIILGEYKQEKTWNTRGDYKPVHGKTARINFQQAFADRVSMRLSLARREAEEAAKTDEAISPEVEHQGAPQSDSVSVVLVRKTEAVQDFYKTNSTARGSYKGGSGAKGYSFSARDAGDSAGRSARLSNSTQIGGSRKAVSA